MPLQNHPNRDRRRKLLPSIGSELCHASVEGELLRGLRVSGLNPFSQEFPVMVWVKKDTFQLDWFSSWCFFFSINKWQSGVCGSCWLSYSAPKRVFPSIPGVFFHVHHPQRWGWEWPNAFRVLCLGCWTLIPWVLGLTPVPAAGSWWKIAVFRWKQQGEDSCISKALFPFPLYAALNGLWGWIFSLTLFCYHVAVPVPNHKSQIAVDPSAFWDY